MVLNKTNKSNIYFFLIKLSIASIKFNKLIPELSVSNIDDSKKFYTELGFEIKY